MKCQVVSKINVRGTLERYRSLRPRRRYKHTGSHSFLLVSTPCALHLTDQFIYHALKRKTFQIECDYTHVRDKEVSKKVGTVGSSTSAESSMEWSSTWILPKIREGLPIWCPPSSPSWNWEQRYYAYPTSSTVELIMMKDAGVALSASCEGKYT